MMKEKWQAFWQARSPGQQKALTATAVVAVVGTVLYVAVADKAEQRHKRQATTSAETQERSLLFDGDTLERDLYDRLQAELEEKSRALEEAQRTMVQQTERMQKLAERMEQAAIAQGEAARRNTLGDMAPELPDMAGVKIPPPPPPPPSQVAEFPRNAPVFQSPTAQNGRPPITAPAEEIVGGIGHTTPTGVIEDEVAPAGSKKNVVRLPPSFMEATLLSGMDAQIGGNAQENPKPTMLRIAAPAVLPNKVRANLKGCFVTASGYGSLAEERINLRLIRLSCVARNGTAVIEEKIKGYVVDADGKVGLHGRVYMKADEHLARQFVAGVAEGIANVAQQNTTITATSPLGTTQTIDPNKLTQAGVASGVGNGMRSLSEFYMNLAKETLPTIEVGPKKKVTLVITEGVDLNIQDNCEACEDA